MRETEEMEIPGFDNVDSFLGYCDTHSRTPRALFSGVHINCLYELMGLKPKYGDKEIKHNIFEAIYSETMSEISQIIKKKRNSIEGVCEGISKNVTHLDDYR